MRGSDDERKRQGAEAELSEFGSEWMSDRVCVQVCVRRIGNVRELVIE